MPPTAPEVLVDPEGIAPSFPRCERGVLLLDDGPRRVEPRGVAPGPRGCRPRVILFHDGPRFLWCRPGELNSALHVFSVTCDRYTRVARISAGRMACHERSRPQAGEVEWLPRMDSNHHRLIQSQESCRWTTGQWRCQRVLPPYLLLDRQACSAATPWHRDRRGGPPRSRTPLQGFGDPAGRWTAARGIWNLEAGAARSFKLPASGSPGFPWSASRESHPHRRFGRPELYC